jgi:hypothetical protein
VFTFIESSIFERLLPVYLDDDEYVELQQYMMQNPEAGQLVRGSGGVRKLRWVRPGMGKRGGVRLILLRAVRAERVLDVVALCQGETEKRAWAYLEAVAGGIS